MLCRYLVKSRDTTADGPSNVYAIGSFATEEIGEDSLKAFIEKVGCCILDRSAQLPSDDLMQPLKSYCGRRSLLDLRKLENPETVGLGQSDWARGSKHCDASISPCKLLLILAS